MAACILTISCHEEESLLPIEFEWSVVNPTDMTVISDYAPINYTVPAEGSKIWLQQFRGPKSDLRWNFSINDKTIDSEIGHFDSSFSLENYATLSFTISDIPIKPVYAFELVPYRYICIDVKPNLDKEIRNFEITITPTEAPAGYHTVSKTFKIKQSGIGI